jgi:hypothetical protein
MQVNSSGAGSRLRLKGEIQIQEKQPNNNRLFGAMPNSISMNELNQ